LGLTMRPMFCFPNWADDGTLSGGTYDVDFPRTNMQDRRPRVIARTSDTLESITQVTVDLGEEKRIDCVALLGTNLSLNAEVQVTIEDAGSSVIYSSGWLDAYPAIYPSGTELWGESVTSVPQDAWDAGKRWPFILLPDTAETTFGNGQIVTVEIKDLLNPEGYIEIGRLWVSSSYQPTTASILQGASFNIDDESTKQTTDGGTYYFVERQRRKSWVLELGYMDDVENKVQILEMKRRLGVSKQLLFVPNRDDELGKYEQAILAVMDQPAPAQVLAKGLYRQPIRFMEEL